MSNPALYIFFLFALGTGSPFLLNQFNPIPPFYSEFYFLRRTPTVLRAPLRPLALFLVFCPRTGRPRRCLMPR